MSDKPLAQKLAIKAGYRLQFINAPQGYAAALGPLPAGAAEAVPGEPCDWIQLFVGSQADLVARLPAAKAQLKPKGLLWVTWRKGSSRTHTDVTRDTIWPFASSLGMGPVSNVSVDDDWSALRLKILD
jgi:hypothetical protein